MRYKILSAVGVTFFVLALSLSMGSIKSYAEGRYEELQLFTKVLNLVQKYYVKDVDAKKLLHGGIKGMLSELDPHTNFLPEEIYKEFESETQGRFGGLGIEITVQKSVLTVISPIEDTPAWKAGIKAGDKIVSINGESTKGLSLVEAAQKMRGKMGSVVKLGIYRDGFQEPKVFPVKRGDVKIRSVKYTDLGEGYAYFKITSFIENTTRDFNRLYSKHKKKSKGVRGAVIDLRKNPGGLLDQAIKMSDLFLEDGTIVSTKGRSDTEFFYAKKEGTLEKTPLILLLDEYSASASEILAGALQDNRRALVMGKKSFGKGSVQSVISLGENKGGLKLTVAQYFTPSGRSIQAEGVSPDVEVENFDPDLLEKAVIKKSVRREKDIKGHILGKKEKERLKKTKTSGGFNLWWNEEENKSKKLSKKDKLLKSDFQILQAYNYLRAWKVMGGLHQLRAKAPSENEQK
tara:strand:- start:61267 stop:62646 length:1380 start_codon:yes stop_codon:yes gene_type:complete